MILVTGAAGVIGRAVMRRLREDGIDAFGVCRQNFDFTSGDSLLDFVPREPDAIIHLAAAVPHSRHYPDTERSASLTRTIDHQVLRDAQKWGSRVVYASGCILYDQKSDAVKTEASPLFLRSKGPYVKAKHHGEVSMSSLPSSATLRISAPLGPGLPPSVVARVFLDLALTGRPIDVWGTGMREQNYVDVRDIADAFVSAAQAQICGVFNVSSDTPTTMCELAEATTEAVGFGVVRASGTPDPREPEFARYSNRQIRATLGWNPRYSLRDSLMSMIGNSNEP